jgi:hypothetical protein
MLRETRREREKKEKGRLVALPTNIRVGWGGLPGENTLAYYEDS